MTNLNSKYKNKVESTCAGDDNINVEYNSYSTEIIQGLIDRKKPTLYGKELFEEKIKSISADKEVIIPFEEEIQCSKPHNFRIIITNTKSKDILLENDDLQILCEKQLIKFLVKKNRQADLFGETVTLTIKEVKDLAGNMMVPINITSSFDGTRRQLVEISSNRSIKGTGCDGIDQNFNSIIDDCGEDTSPPSLLLHGTHVFKHHKYPNASYLQNPAFSSLEDAKDFLSENIIVSDDCADNLDIGITSSDALCDETLFEIKVTDPICGEVNPVQTLSRSYLLRVDNTAPSISLGFHSISKPIFYDAKKKILMVKESRKSLINAFWHTIEVSKKCNEFRICDLTKEFHYLGQLQTEVKGRRDREE